ncbi:52K [Bovine mastadenovirus A]|uniref:52K n=1 Tax=Bovine mastadenovirus A TaxID=129953 RepID=UPI0000443F8D|nr:52K [Bovine mastadenovirus A]
MHPVLRQLKPLPHSKASPVVTWADDDPAPTPPIQEGEGVARLNVESPEQHPRVQLKKDAGEAFVPPANVFRDREGEEEAQMRHMRFKAGEQMHVPKKRVLSDTDFEVDEVSGVSPAKAHMAAADLLTAYQQTVREEVNFQKTFNNNVRTLVAREEVAVGLMHLWDFVEAYVVNPSSKALTAQLFLIVQHCRDEGILKESLLNIAEPESRWLLDLINLLQTIVVQERGMSITEKVAAINYSVITLSKHYARKVYRTPFVPIDKEAKITTFYMRIVVKLLVLSDDLGMYRNERMERVVSAARRREFTDKELMFSLRKALAGEDEVYDGQLESAVQSVPGIEWAHEDDDDE